MKKFLTWALIALWPNLALATNPVPPPLPYVFQPGVLIQSGQMNADLNYIVNNINAWAASGVGVGTITGVTAGTGLSGGGTGGTVALSISNTAVTAGSYTCGSFTVNGQGQLTNATSTACGGGNGTVTSVGSGTGLTGGPITTSGSLSLATMTSPRILANVSGGSAAPIANTLTAILDAALGSTQGTVIYRGGSLWQTLSPGTAGQFLRTGGVSANPTWGTGGTVSNIATGNGLTGGPITGTGTIALIAPVSVANGGTGTTTASIIAANNIGALAEGNNLSDVANATTARSNILAAASGANGDITSLTGLTTPLSVPQGGTGVTSVTSSLPVIGAGAGNLTTGARSGNTTTFGTTSGALTSGHAIVADASGNLVDGGAPLGAGTVTSITAGSGLSGGTITTSGTIGISAPIPATLGGTGTLINTNHGVLLGQGTNPIISTQTNTAAAILVNQSSSADPAWESVSGDCTLAAAGAITCLKTNGTAFGTMAVQNANNVNISGGAAVFTAGLNYIPPSGNAPAVIGAGGSGTNNTASITLNGGSGSLGGGFAAFERNGTIGAVFGNLAAIGGSGSGMGIFATTGNDIEMFANNNFGLQIDTLGNTVVQQQLKVVAMTQTSVAQSGTACYNSGTGLVTYDATLGCLTSLEEQKNNLGWIEPVTALREVMALKPFWGTWKPGVRDGDPHEQPFLGAHQVESVDPRLAGYGEDGKLRGVRYEEMTAFLVAAIQAQQQEIDALKRHSVAKKPH